VIDSAGGSSVTLEPNSISIKTGTHRIWRSLLLFPSELEARTSRTTEMLHARRTATVRPHRVTLPRRRTR
jgi:hypothetical protein